jgi:hypothetical protein
LGAFVSALRNVWHHACRSTHPPVSSPRAQSVGPAGRPAASGRDRFGARLISVRLFRSWVRGEAIAPSACGGQAHRLRPAGKSNGARDSARQPRSTGSVAQRLDYDEWGCVLNGTAPGFQPMAASSSRIQSIQDKRGDRSPARPAGRMGRPACLGLFVALRFSDSLPDPGDPWEWPAVLGVIGGCALMCALAVKRWGTTAWLCLGRLLDWFV